MESSSPSNSKRLTSPEAAVTGKSCPICLRHVDIHRADVITACMHAYCHSCLLRWTSYKRRCPLCNADFQSYYSNLHQISSITFRKLHLPPPPSRTFPSSDESRHRHRLTTLQREIRRTRREKVIGLSSRSRPLTRRDRLVGAIMSPIMLFMTGFFNGEPDIEKSRNCVQLPDSQDDLLVPLRRFLDGWTNMFWHELRCFAESDFTMDTYDTVVEYKPLD